MGRSLLSALVLVESLSPFTTPTVISGGSNSWVRSTLAGQFDPRCSGECLLCILSPSVDFDDDNNAVHKALWIDGSHFCATVWIGTRLARC
eukprot:m.26064 g.26064  ORF g.26064 m.26064 type:complete len:91 (+) comp6268_c0_seq2:423-695(+)